MIERQVGLMARLLDDLLDVSRVTRNAIELQREWIDLRSVVRDVVSLVRPTIEGLRQHLQLDLPPEPAWAHGDPEACTRSSTTCCRTPSSTARAARRSPSSCASRRASSG